MTAPRLHTPAQVLAVGMTYRDLVLTGMSALPRLGEENYAAALHETWGGIATMARVCRALGLETGLCTAIGDDDISEALLRDMATQGIDTTLTVRHAGWRLPVTVALSVSGDRAMVTVEESPPGGIAAHLDDEDPQVAAIVVDMRDPAAPWLQRARERGTTVFASRGFDPTGEWGEGALAAVAGCDVWMLNQLEARAFTGQEDPVAAARMLTARVPLVIVTLGAHGMVAVDGAKGEEARAASFPVEPLSTTGAGDTTLAAFIFASQIPGLTLAQRLDVAAFIGASTIELPGGAANPLTPGQLLARAESRTSDPRLVFLRDVFRAAARP